MPRKKDISPRTRFRGYAIPGDPVPGSFDDPTLALNEGETLDVLCGHFRIFQLRKGHRYSTDDILTAWYGTSWCPMARTILDLGSGIGSVAMVAAWRLSGTRVVTIEAQEESVALARKSVRWNGLEERFDIREGDFREPAALAPEEKFDLVLGSPPYFPLGTGVEGDHPQKIACRFEVRGDITDYCQTAAAHLQTGGTFACVFPLTRISDQMSSRGAGSVGGSKARADFPAGLGEDTLSKGKSSATPLPPAMTSHSRQAGENCGLNPAEQAERVRDAARKSNLTILRQRAVVLREPDAPLLGLFLMMRSCDLPEEIHHQTWEEPALIIRREDGSVHPEYAAVKISFGFPP